MKLDPKTGELDLGSIVLRPGALTHRGVAHGAHTWTVIARFSGKSLAQITLFADDAAFGTSWDDYTEDKEHARRKVHDAFLVRALGAAHQADDEHFVKAWAFPWGRVHSTHDPRGGATDIQIIFA